MIKQLLNKVLERGVVNIYAAHKLPEGEDQRKALERALNERASELSFYLGIDPTAPFLHLGHAIPVRKLEQLRQLGCKVTLLIGDFTATIGDPTDKTAARKVLTPEEVKRNAENYLNLLSKILGINDSKNPS